MNTYLTTRCIKRIKESRKSQVDTQTRKKIARYARYFKCMTTNQVDTSLKHVKMQEPTLQYREAKRPKRM